MNTKKFSKSYNDVLDQAYLFHGELVLDQAKFEAFSSSFSLPFVDDFLSDIQSADDLPTNQNDLNHQTLLTHEVEVKLEESRAHFQKLILFVGMAWSKSEAMLKAFGNDVYLEARKSPLKMTDLLRGAFNLANSETEKDILIAAGFSQKDINLLNSLSEELTDKMNEQTDYIQHSMVRADERTGAFNKVWDSMVRISNTSKIIFKDSPAKMDYYKLYPANRKRGPKKTP